MLVVRSERGRTALAFLMLLAGLVLLTQLATGAADAKGKGKVKVSVKVKTKDQGSLLENGKLKVAVKAKGTRKVKVSAGPKGKKALFKSKTVRFKKSKRKATAQLKLTGAGRDAFTSCETEKVKVTASYKDGKKRKKAKGKGSLKPDAARCGAYKPVPVENADRCDFLDPRVCLQPFPNDYFTKPDASSPTGKRLNINLQSTPANTDGVHIDPSDMNRGDGFSPGNMIIVKIPEVETPAAFNNSGFVPITNLGAYDDPDQAVMVINAETGERQPIWAELDANPTAVDPGPGGPGGIGQNPSNTGPVNLIIRPAKNFDFGERYIVALRNVRDANNQPVQAPIGFRVYRDNDVTDQPEVEARRPHMESIINDLVTKAGVQRESLYMAWDFTVASEQSVTSRATTIRDDAFAELGDTNLADRVIQGNSPDWTITSTTPTPNANTLRRVEGTINDIPCYLDQNGCPTGAKFSHGPNGEITWDESYTTDVPFRCTIPASTLNDNPGSVTPAVPGLYGHGLLGSYGQVNGQETLGNRSNTIWCAMDWEGFATQDVPTVLEALKDMSNFPRLVDRMQQGFVNFMYLGRALAHPNGLATDPAFEADPDGGGPDPAESVIDTSDGFNQRINYMGISQGAIMGGALTALLPDADRGVLNVTGMNYSTLLRRSVDSDEYFKIPGLGLYANYPNELERPLLLSLIQLLWDRGEGNGYAQHMTSDPLPKTPKKTVLIEMSIGDHQVANIQAEVEARTIGAMQRHPAFDAGRSAAKDPGLALGTLGALPRKGSAIIPWDIGPLRQQDGREMGTPVPPVDNRPNTQGQDPHDYVIENSPAEVVPVCVEHQNVPAGVSVYW